MLSVLLILLAVVVARKRKIERRALGYAKSVNDLAYGPVNKSRKPPCVGSSDEALPRDLVNVTSQGPRKEAMPSTSNQLELQEYRNLADIK